MMECEKDLLIYMLATALLGITCATLFSAWVMQKAWLDAAIRTLHQKGITPPARPK